MIFISNVCYSQEYNEQIVFSLSNDKLADQDKYFTSGLSITYKKLLDKSFLFSKTDNNKLQYNISVGNEIYTPENLSSTNVNNFDRPYAGWLFGKFKIVSIKDKSASSLAFETGITGEESLSGTLQIWYHDFFGIDSSPSWVEEIAFKWLFNVKAAHIYNWEFNANNALHYRVAGSLGTKDIFLENDIGYFFGNFNSLKNSSRVGAIDTTVAKEFYGFISGGYKYVLHNALIHGSLFRDEVLFTTPIEQHILKLEAGSVLKINRNTFKIVYNFNSKETPLATSHAYGTISYARSF